MAEFGRVLLLLGIVLVVIGGVLSLVGRVPWIGRLPGDIYVERENFTFYFPLGTCLLLSVVATLAFWFFRR